MQELIGTIKTLINDDEALPFMWHEDILKLLESMLEKEKEAMCEFAVRWRHEDFTRKEIAKDFNETFNTKEK